MMRDKKREEKKITHFFASFISETTTYTHETTTTTRLKREEKDLHNIQWKNENIYKKTKFKTSQKGLLIKGRRNKQKINYIYEYKSKEETNKFIYIINIIAIQIHGAERERDKTTNNKEEKKRIIEFYLSNTKLNSLQIHFRKKKNN